MDEELWLERMRHKLQKKFTVSRPGKIRGTKLVPSFDTCLVDKREALMKKRREGVFRKEPDGTLSFLAKTPEGGAVKILVDEIDMDLADDDIWRVIYSNGSPYIVSRFFIPEFGAAKLCTIIAQRKYGEHAPIGRLTHENGVAMDCTRGNLLSTPERAARKSWEARIREWLRNRRRSRRVTEEMEKSFKVARRRKANAEKIHANIHRPRKYIPTQEEVLLDSWIGAYERSPKRWRVVLKTPENMKAWEGEKAEFSHETELAALTRAFELWIPYMKPGVDAESIAYAQRKIDSLPKEPNPLKDATAQLLGDFKHEA